MARDFKPGDMVRSLGESAKIESIAKDVVRPVFNLEVAEPHDDFVGRADVLAGERTLQNVQVRLRTCGLGPESASYAVRLSSFHNRLSLSGTARAGSGDGSSLPPADSWASVLLPRTRLALNCF